MKEICIKNLFYLKKTLVSCLIILFIGVGIQPAFAVNTSAFVSYGEDDCDICPSIKKIKNLEDKKENNKLSNTLDEHLEWYNDLKFDITEEDKPICEILYKLRNYYLARAMLWMIFYHNVLIVLEYIFPNFHDFYIIFLELRFQKIFDFIMDNARRMDCEWIDDYYPW